MSGARQHVYLIPGFFGFENFGELQYFAHVRELLGQVLTDYGQPAQFHGVRTFPTASIRRRTLSLLEAIAESAPDDDSPIHLIGHSTGGLDARLLVSPGVSLPGRPDVERFARRVRSVICVATPHHGTPTASFFNTLLGQRVLQLISLATIYTLRFGRLPLSVLLPLLGVLTGLDDLFTRKQDTLDQLYVQLLRDFSPERSAALQAFFHEVSADQSLLPQLTPEGIDLFNAAATPRPDVRYGSVVTRARRPGLRSAVAVGLGAYPLANLGLYAGCYRLAERTSGAFRPTLTETQSRALRLGYGSLPDGRDNDGMVPTLSQVWGEVIHAVWADHLDVIGHFDDPGRKPPHFDWLVSGTGFSRRDFENMWTRIGAFLVGSASTRPWAEAGSRDGAPAPLGATPPLHPSPSGGGSIAARATRAPRDVEPW